MIDLSINHFKITGNSTPQTLSFSSPGLALIFFKSNQSEYSKRAEPIFHRMSQHPAYSHIKFCVYDVELGNNRRIVQLSRNTRTPVMQTPLIIAYNNSIPVMKCSKNQDNPRVINEFINALLEKQGTKNTVSNHFAAPQQTQLNFPDGMSMPNMNAIVKTNPKHDIGILDDQQREIILPAGFIPKTKPWMKV